MMITPSFNLTATERVLPKLALDFTTANLDSRVTFTRSGDTATVVNSSGTIQSALSNIPRFDFDPVSLLCKGLLIEEARTNLCLQSQDFTVSPTWTTARANVASSSVVSPDGGTNATKLTEDATASNTHFIYQTPTLASSTDYTWSVFVKAAERTKVGIVFADRAGVLRGRVFDLSTGTSSAAPAGFSAPTSFSMQEFKDDWYRCVVTANSATGVGAFPCRVYVADAAGNLSYTGDGTSGLYIYGAQCEAGAFPTSYIPTTLLSVTRNADVATMTGTNFSDWYNATEGAINVAFTMQGSDSTTRKTFEIGDGGTTNLIDSYVSSLAGNARVRVSGSNQCLFGGSASASQKLTLAYKADNFAAAFSGAATQTDTAGAIPAGMTQLRLGSNAASGNVLCGWLESFEYYPQRLTNNEVRATSK